MKEIYIKIILITIFIFLCYVIYDKLSRISFPMESPEQEKNYCLDRDMTPISQLPAKCYKYYN